MSSSDLLIDLLIDAIDAIDPVTDGDLKRAVDESWDPPVTLAVRLVSVISDGRQHAGQAAYVRGLVKRAGH